MRDLSIAAAAQVPEAGTKNRRTASATQTTFDVLFMGYLRKAFLCPTSKMSHDRGRRDACRIRNQVLWFQFGTLSIARGVTAMVVGSGALLAPFFITKNAEQVHIVEAVITEVRTSHGTFL